MSLMTGSFIAVSATMPSGFSTYIYVPASVTAFADNKTCVQGDGLAALVVSAEDALTLWT